MCGRYNVRDSLEVRMLMEQLRLPNTRPTPQLNVPPGGVGQFVAEAAGERHLLTGIWSLLIERKPTGNGHRPNPKFQTFNARSDRLTSSPLWKKVYPYKRCILPVSGFHEWKGKQVYNIHPESEAAALAGLWQSWQFEDDIVNSFTVITLPAHPRFSHIHPKSIPLMLRPNDFELWLDSDFYHVDTFQTLMTSHISAPLMCEPVHSPNDLRRVGEAERLAADSGWESGVQRSR